MLTRTPLFTAGGEDFDPTDPHLFTTDRHLAVWRQARARHPVAWQESADGGLWSVTGHRAGSELLRRPAEFTSTLGMRLGSSPQAVRAAAGQMLVVADGPAHRRLRTAHSAWFTPRALAGLRAELLRRLDARLAELLDRGTPFDVVGELTALLPAWALLGMMGVPAADWDHLVGLTLRAFDDDERGPEAAAARTEAHTEVFLYFADLLDRRRAEPGDDMVSALAQAVVDGRPLTDEEIVLNCDGLMNGGLETTPHAASGAMLAFARHPEVWRRLRQDPELTDRAVEEILRYTSPPMHAMRTATVDATLGDASIRAGDRVVVWFPSCNADDTVFTEPERFVVDRWPNPHLGFGGGPHYCIGAALARLELRCLLETLARRVEAFEVTGAVVRQPSNFLNGLRRLDLALTPAPSAGGTALTEGRRHSGTPR
ncbi:cytochrome P450 [Micromonospora sp. NPDC050187]|uniref:cytochrome P450 n=1 Tax=Micromonospora sp. NPDC050187 TaxID=3364277 RepID=UPI0037B7E24D